MEADYCRGSGLNILHPAASIKQQGTHYYPHVLYIVERRQCLDSEEVEEEAVERPEEGALQEVRIAGHPEHQSRPSRRNVSVGLTAVNGLKGARAVDSSW